MYGVLNVHVYSRKYNQYFILGLASVYQLVYSYNIQLEAMQLLWILCFNKNHALLGRCPVPTPTISFCETIHYAKLFSCPLVRHRAEQ